jgi:cell division protein ZapA
MAELNLEIAGRGYRIACRDGEEENLRRAAQLVDAKSREALAGLGALSEARQLLFAALLLGDQLIDRVGPAPTVTPPPPPPGPDPLVVRRVEAIADRIERLATDLEKSVANT